MSDVPTTVWGAVAVVASVVGVFLNQAVAPLVKKIVDARVDELTSRRRLIERATEKVVNNSSDIREIKEAVEDMKDSSDKILAILEKGE